MASERRRSQTLISDSQLRELRAFQHSFARTAHRRRNLFCARAADNETAQLFILFVGPRPAIRCAVHQMFVHWCAKCCQ